MNAAEDFARVLFLQRVSGILEQHAVAKANWKGPGPEWRDRHL